MASPYRSLVELGPKNEDGPWARVEIDDADRSDWTGTVLNALAVPGSTEAGRVEVRILDGPRRGHVATADTILIDDETVTLRGVTPFQPEQAPRSAT
jgi:hypothetical protein